MAHSEETHVLHSHRDKANAITEMELNPNDLFEMSKLSPFLSSNMVGKHSRFSFPLKLHLMLKQVEDDDLAHIVCWQPHGRCLIVKDREKFSDVIMPRFFRQSKFSSFLRQLNAHGFKRITAGLDKGAYYHELFLRGKLSLSNQIQRLHVKGIGTQKANSADAEPNFYQMAFVEDSMSAEAPKLPNKDEPKHVTSEHLQQGILLQSGLFCTNSYDFQGIEKASQSNSPSNYQPKPLSTSLTWPHQKHKEIQAFQNVSKVTKSTHSSFSTEEEKNFDEAMHLFDKIPVSFLNEK